MQNGTGPEPQNDPQSPATTYGTPSSDLVVFAGDFSHRVPKPFSTVDDGISVIAAGMVDDITEHGTTDPSATFHLVNEFGQATYAYASPQVLAEFGLYLVNGMEVSLHGISRRPYPGTPPYVHILQVEPLTD
ncbi:hypothetical protein [Streptomyces africanus]|uniref:hypothetical protein n=1 Tax=Streptomyces africanus TaxID=231024 RepID=UPI000A38FB72|nr:hypothetical protein [Streptomyces africanus]